MLQKISWPTAAILLGVLGAAVTLTVLGKPVPAWLLGLVGAVTSSMPGLISAGKDPS